MSSERMGSVVMLERIVHGKLDSAFAGEMFASDIVKASHRGGYDFSVSGVEDTFTIVRYRVLEYLGYVKVTGGDDKYHVELSEDGRLVHRTLCNDGFAVLLEGGH